jgi:hypothetical protein
VTIVHQLLTPGEAQRLTQRIKEAARAVTESSIDHHVALRRAGISRSRVAGQHLYLIQAGANGPVKIGSASNVETRLGQLQTGNPYELRIVTVLHGMGSREREAHEKFAYFRMAGEWFEPIPEVFEWFRTEAI